MSLAPWRNLSIFTPRPAAGGFTAIELLVVLAIVAILVAVAVPSFRSMIISNRINGHIGGLIDDLQFARAEAWRTGQSLGMCASRSATSCDVTNGDWVSGWIVFSDPGPSASMTGSSTVLRVHGALTGAYMFQSVPTTNGFQLNREGFLMGLSNGRLVLRLDTAPIDTTLTRCLSVNVTGFARNQALAAGSTTCP